MDEEPTEEPTHEDRVLTDEEVAGFQKRAKAQLQEFLAAGNIEEYLTFLPGHERQGEFFRLAHRLSDKSYWETLRETYMHEETTFHRTRKWAQMFRVPRPFRELLMTKSEQRALNGMGDVIRVYRGIGDVNFVNGISWTLSLERARIFAMYACGPRRRMFGQAGKNPLIVSGRCKKADVLALFSSRKEQEIVVPGGLVFEKSTRPFVARNLGKYHGAKEP